jgi:Tetracyclin repressor-like, C-terminal domain
VLETLPQALHQGTVTNEINLQTVRTEAKQAFLQLEETMRPFLKGAVDDGERAQRLTLAWSAVHGFATLVLGNRLAPLYGAGGPQGASRAGKQMLELLTLVF